MPRPARIELQVISKYLTDEDMSHADLARLTAASYGKQVRDP